MKTHNSLTDGLHHLLQLAKIQDISVQTMIETLATRGQALILVLFSLPFCQPIQIPGFSTPFGIIMAFIGLRIAFGHRIWIPKALLEKKIPYPLLKKIASFALKVNEKLSFFISTRWEWIVKNTVLHIAHGLTITLMAMLLSLPLPIPFTNLLCAYPILAFGLGLLEDDGFMILAGYCLTLIALFTFTMLIWFGKESFSTLMASS